MENSQQNAIHLAPGVMLKGKKFNYEVVDVLGEGSFGITYLAKLKLEAGLGVIDGAAKVAIKEFFMHDINGRDASCSVTNASADGIYDHYKKKFIKEAYALSRVKHPFVVNVLEYFEANNTVYYTMELLTGGSIDDVVVSQNGLTEDQLIKYTAQLCAALSHMHACRMIHLDLKPSNVMLRQDGSIALIDFGLSKQYDPNGNPESSTSVSGGTPGYSPLEQMSYNSNIDKGLPVTMDIYALGATMYKMITAQLPPLASDILNDGFPTQMLEERGTRPEIIAIIQKAMAPLKKNRYQSIREMYDALLPFIPQQYRQDVLAADAVVETEPMPELNRSSEGNVPKAAPAVDKATVVMAPQPQPQPQSAPTPQPVQKSQPKADDNSDGRTIIAQPTPQPAKPAPQPKATPAKPTVKVEQPKPVEAVKPAPQPAKPVEPAKTAPQPVKPAEPVKPAPKRTEPAPEEKQGGSKKGLVIGIIAAVLVIGGILAIVFSKGNEEEITDQGQVVQVEEGTGEETPAEGEETAPADEAATEAPAAQAPAQDQTPATQSAPTQPAPAQTAPDNGPRSAFGGAATYDKAEKTITFSRGYVISKGDGTSVDIPAGSVIKNAFVSSSGEFRSGQLVTSSGETITLMGYSVKI